MPGYQNRLSMPICWTVISIDMVILALKVILLDRLQGIICSVTQEPYLVGFMLWCSGAIAARASHIKPLFAVCVCV